MAVGEQAVVTDAMEAGWEDVEQEAAHELAGVETHDLAPMTAVLAIVLPVETDMGRVKIEQTAVGDRDAMRIAREIGQDLLRTGEGLFAIDDPFAQRSSAEAHCSGSKIGEKGVSAVRPQAARSLPRYLRARSLAACFTSARTMGVSSSCRPVSNSGVVSQFDCGARIGMWTLATRV